jgi:hypothetical protein
MMSHGMGHGSDANAASTPGWSMMSPEERQAHRYRIQSASSREDCARYMEQHHQRMIERAKQRGESLPAPVRPDVCAGMNR